ncbi:MAG TPA: cytochrome b/b6 domain-containing protein [Anaerolineales bacterium]|nr:cytochrome b/b6 domain-containing protein [Anaerolineales bacterium]
MTENTSTPARELISDAPPPEYTRFTLSDRLQHIVMLVSFITLAITGLAQKYALSPISLSIIQFWGGVEKVRATHHTAAIVLMLIAVYHVINLGYKLFVLRKPMTMLPSLQDARDALTAFAYNLGLRKTGAQMGRYTFEEKAEYWALVWGILIMGVTGFIMWNPIATVRFLPGQFIPAAKVAHGAEAVLAVLAIIVWHMYGVHLRKFNKSMWTGKLTEQEMLHEHPLELADIKAGMAGSPTDPAALRRRRLIYYPIAALLGGAMLFAVYGFVNGEQTAITTVPPQPNAVAIFVPYTPTPLPPTPTPIPPTPTVPPSPTAELASGTTASTSAAPAVTWAQVGPIFAAKCAMCHGPALATNGLNLSTYADAMKGAQDGPVIVPSDSANSKLFQIQSKGGHPGQLSADELAIIKAWIDSGAVER